MYADFGKVAQWIELEVSSAKSDARKHIQIVLATRLTHDLPDETSPVDVAVEVYRHLAAGRPRIVLASL